jgi:hypothetical protein
VELSAILNAGIAYTRVVLTVGVNVHITSGKGTGIINSPLNVCETRKKMFKLVLEKRGRGKESILNYVDYSVFDVLIAKHSLLFT